MGKYIPGTQKHLTLEYHICIGNSLNMGCSFKDITHYLRKDFTRKLRLNVIPVPPKRNGYSIFIGTNITHTYYSISLILIPFISKLYV